MWNVQCTNYGIGQSVHKRGSLLTNSLSIFLSERNISCYYFTTKCIDLFGLYHTHIIAPSKHRKMTVCCVYNMYVCA